MTEASPAEIAADIASWASGTATAEDLPAKPAELADSEPARTWQRQSPRDESLALLFGRMARAGVSVSGEQAAYYATMPDRALVTMIAKYSAVTETLGPLNDEVWT